MQTVKEMEYQMFPLETFLHNHPIDYQQLFRNNLPNLLLSQIRSLRRDYVEQLELVGIYDTDDFLKAGVQIQDHLHIDETSYDSILQLLQEAQREKLAFPQIILDLPDNYALITIISTPVENKLGIYWRGLRVKYQKGRDEYWNPIKHKMDVLMKQMGYPEFIGRIILQDPPHWLEIVTPLSTYLSNIIYSGSLIDYAISWGLPTRITSDYDLVDQHILSQLYLLQLGNNYKEFSKTA